MENVNEFNWQHLVLQMSGIEEPVGDFDSCLINRLMNNIASNPKTLKFVFLPQLEWNINLYLSTIRNKNGQMNVLKKSKNNDRWIRKRPDTHQKNDFQRNNGLISQSIKNYQLFGIGWKI